MRIARLLLGFLAAVMLLHPSASTAQYYAFGKNKVQYDTFEWLVLTGEHVEVFYYPEEEPLARLALVMAEESYQDLSAKFRHDVPQHVPLIVYSHHSHFEQTNVSPFFIPEGVQGFTEFSKGRVVLPFTGSFAEFRHVLHHEMVHVFQFSVLDAIYRKYRRASYTVPPLWFSEGLAEYWSMPWDAQGTMVLSDLVLEGTLPEIGDLWRYNGTFTIYKIGQSLCAYIAERFGEDALRRLYAEIHTEDRFDRLIQRVTGTSVRRLSEDWIYAVKRRYYPTVKDRTTLALGAEERALRQGMNLKPVAVPDTTLLGGKRYLFLSARSGYTNIYSASYEGREQDVKSIVRGQRSAQFESFHPFQSRIDVSRDGDLLFVSKWNGRDALVVFDVAERKIVDRYLFDDLIALSSPAWAPQGDRIAFAGLRADGQSDLYVYDRARGVRARLTNDYYADADPTWSPDGNEIAFTSDRSRYGRDGHHNLFLLDVRTLEVRYLTSGPWSDLTPAWSPDGSRIAFASDRDGMFGLYTVDRDGRGASLTSVLGATLDPSWLPDGSGLLFTGYRRGGFGIYQMPLPEAVADSFTLSVDQGPPQWTWDETLARGTGEPKPYEPRYGLDLVQGGIAVSPTENIGEGLQGAVSDLLGNRIYYFTVGNTAQTSGEILSRMNASLWYLNRQNRWNYGVGGFHVAGDFEDALGLDYFERRAGASLLLSYPFSRFNRVQGTAEAYYDQKELDTGTLREGFLTTHSLSLVRDNTLWFPTGPRDGTRYNLTGSITTNWNTGRTENVTLSADYRRYYRVSQWSSIALRVLGRASSGVDPVRFSMGGTHSLRGYGRRSLYGTRIYLANLEYRFPLLDRLVLGFPLKGLELPGIEGALFTDAGNAWEKFERFPRPKGSLGLGLRMSLGGYFVLRYDLARRTDFRAIEPGWEREFYLGFNY